MSPAVLHLLPDTTLPGLTTRRIWQESELYSPGLILLTVNRLYIRSEPLSLSQSDLQRLLIGGNVDEQLGPTTQMYPLTDLDHAALDLETYTVRLIFRGDRPQPELLRFRSAAVADDFFTKLARRVQEQFQPIVPKFDVLQAMRTPIAAMFGVVTGMVTMNLLANSYADLSEYRFLLGDQSFELPGWYAWADRFFQIFPPRLMGTLSGAVLAILQLWAYRRLTQPPQSVELVPRLESRASL